MKMENSTFCTVGVAARPSGVRRVPSHRIIQLLFQLDDCQKRDTTHRGFAVLVAHKVLLLGGGAPHPEVDGVRYGLVLGVPGQVRQVALEESDLAVGRPTIQSPASAALSGVIERTE